MYIDKIFSNYEDNENLYSVILDDEEVALFSDIQERLYMLNRTTGEYYTVDDLRKTMNKLHADRLNGTSKIMDVNGKFRSFTPKEIKHYKKQGLIDAYVEHNRIPDGTPVKTTSDFEKLRRREAQTMKLLEHKGVIKNLKINNAGGVSSWSSGSIPKSKLAAAKKSNKFINVLKNVLKH